MKKAVKEGMGKLRGLDLLLCLFPTYSTCLCTTINNNHHNHIDEHERDNMPLILHKASALKLKHAAATPTTLALQLKPKMVVLRVNIHCNGCARKVEKHISKLEGVSSYEIDLETKMVVVTGDIVPYEVLESVSRVKYAELWDQ